MASGNHYLLNWNNPLKDKLGRREPVLGVFLVSASPIVAELCATLPLDWVIVDTEASPLSREGLGHVLQALGGAALSPIVRVQRNEQSEIEHALDLGSHGVLVPKVSTPAAAIAAAGAMFFPPRGTRGINPIRASGYFADVPGYLKNANDRTLCMVQIETQEGLENVREIAQVPGIDILFIGPGDLASALGQPGDVTGPKMDEARRQVLDAAREAGISAGIFAYSLELAKQYLEEGFLFVAIGNDLKYLRGAISADLEHFAKCVSAGGSSS